MSEETILQMVEPGTPPGYKDAIIEIRSPNGTKRITIDRLAEITTQSRRLSRGRKALGAMLFDRLIEPGFGRILSERLLGRGDRVVARFLRVGGQGSRAVRHPLHACRAWSHRRAPWSATYRWRTPPADFRFDAGSGDLLDFRMEPIFCRRGKGNLQTA